MLIAAPFYVHHPRSLSCPSLCTHVCMFIHCIHIFHQRETGYIWTCISNAWPANCNSLHTNLDWCPNSSHAHIKDWPTVHDSYASVLTDTRVICIHVFQSPWEGESWEEMWLKHISFLITLKIENFKIDFIWLSLIKTGNAYKLHATRT